MQALNQVIAVEKSVKTRVNNEVTSLYHTAQKPGLFEGFTKTYQPKTEGDETFPAEGARVQFNVNDVLRQVGNKLTELFDVTATKDYANCTAKADVVVDGVVLAKDAPATFLLFLEKQLTDLHTVTAKLPVLDPSQEWQFDSNASLFKSPATQTAKTKKVTKALVLYPATDKHPAQTAQVAEDVITGYWNQMKMSGAVPENRKRSLMEKIEKLQKAVKFAREQANMVEAPEKNVGEKLFSWLFS